MAQQGLLTLMKMGAFEHNHDVCRTLNRRPIRPRVHDGTKGLTNTVSSFLRNLFVIFTLLSPAVLFSAVASESERFDTFLEAIYQRTLSRSPMLSTTLGNKQNNDSWDDLSMAHINENVRLAWQDLNDLHRQFDYSKLDPPGQLNYRVFEAGLKLRIERDSWRYHFNPLNQIVGLHLEIPGLLTAYHTIDNKDDARAYIARVQSVGTPVDQFIIFFKDRENRGFSIPKNVLPRLIQAAESIISGELQHAETENILFSDFKRKVRNLAIEEELQEKLITDMTAAITAEFIPAYQRLIGAFRQHQTLDLNDDGVWHLPDGDQFYQFLLGQFTTTGITADEVHELGLREVKRIHEEMDRIRIEVGFTGDLTDFFTHLKTSPEFFYPDTDQGRAEYLQRAQDIASNAAQRIKDILPEVPPNKLVVQRIEAYREKSAPVGFYEAGTSDGKVPGTVFLGMYDMASAAQYDLDSLMFHEGIPGHHLQLSVMQAQAHIPRLRTYYVWWSNTAFTEGWALYAEYLAKEMGLYKDPYANFGRYAGELWRACRLVVDSGLHAKRWTREQAINYLNENTASSAINNARAVDRYLAVPGQATAFKIGMMRILDVRQKASAALGDKFDIREFHQVILENGLIPLSIMEEQVQAWVRKKQTH